MKCSNIPVPTREPGSEPDHVPKLAQPSTAFEPRRAGLKMTVRRDQGRSRVGSCFAWSSWPTSKPSLVQPVALAVVGTRVLLPAQDVLLELNFRPGVLRQELVDPRRR